MSLEASEIDINDAFEAILLSEQRIAKKALKDGFKKGAADGLLEGYHLGYHRGADLGFEIGFYRGVLSTLTNIEKFPPRLVSVRDKLLSSLELIPDENKDDCDILSAIETARAAFKHFTSLWKLRISPTFVSTNNF